MRVIYAPDDGEETRSRLPTHGNPTTHPGCVSSGALRLWIPLESLVWHYKLLYKIIDSSLEERVKVSPLKTWDTSVKMEKHPNPSYLLFNLKKKRTSASQSEHFDSSEQRQARQLLSSKACQCLWEWAGLRLRFARVLARVRACVTAEERKREIGWKTGRMPPPLATGGRQRAAHVPRVQVMRGILDGDGETCQWF